MSPVLGGYCVPREARIMQRNVLRRAESGRRCCFWPKKDGELLLPELRECLL